MMIGVYYLSIFAASLISGRMGGLYEVISAAMFWSLHAAIVALAGAIFAALAALAASRFARTTTPSDVAPVEEYETAFDPATRPSGAFSIQSAMPSPDLRERPNFRME